MLALSPKKHYAETILKEIGFIGNPINTYSSVNKCPAEVIGNIIKYSKCLSFTLLKKEKTLPIMY